MNNFVSRSFLPNLLVLFFVSIFSFVITLSSLIVYPTEAAVTTGKSIRAQPGFISLYVTTEETGVNSKTATNITQTNSSLDVYSSPPINNTPPTIDGVLSSGEWGSPSITKTMSTGENDTHVMTVYFINDNSYLYIGAKITNDDFECDGLTAGLDMDRFDVFFDNNNNGIFDVNEDIKAFWNLLYYDQHCRGEGSWGSDSNPSDGVGIATHSNKSGIGDYIYEFKIPLNSGDIEDSTIGSSVGLTIMFTEMFYASKYWSAFEENTASWPDGNDWSPCSFGKLHLATVTQPYIIINGVTEGSLISKKTNLTATVTPDIGLQKIYYYLLDKENNFLNVGESFTPGNNWLMELDPAKYDDGAYKLAAGGIRQDNGENIYSNPINIVVGQDLIVTSTNPLDNAQNVGANTKNVTITFNKEIQEGPALAYNNIKVVNNSHYGHYGETVYIAKNISEKSLIITRGAGGEWSYSTNYIVTIPAGSIKDKIGFDLKNEKVFNFTITDRPITVKFNNVEKDVTPEPFINNTTHEIMVPYQFFELFNPSEIYYDPTDQQVTIVCLETRVIIDVLTSKMYVYHPDNPDKTDDCTVVFKNGQPFISLRTVAESFGAVVEWFDDDYLVKITYTPQAIALPDLKFVNQMIIFDNNKPPFLPNELRVTALIANNGLGRARIPVVKFLFNGDQFEQKTLAPLEPGGSVIAEAMWQASFNGQNGVMQVKLELSGQEDGNTSNNLATKAIELNYADFRHNRDAFKFENWGWNSRKEYLDELDLWLKNKYSPFLIDAWSNFLNPILLTSTSGGHCAGMARASTNWYIWPALKPVSTSPFQMDNTGTVKSEIIDYCFKQILSSLAQEPFKKLYNASNEYNTIISSLNDNRPIVVSLRNRNQNGGHSVVAYKALEIGTNEKRVFIYDSNLPYNDPSDGYEPFQGKVGDNWITFDISQNEALYGSYDLAFAVLPWQYMRNEDIVAAIEQIIRNVIEDLYNSGKTMFGIHSPVTCFVQNESGDKFGFYNGDFVNEIPGAELEEVMESQYFYLPLGHTYTIHLTGTDSGVLGLDFVEPTSSSQAKMVTYSNIPVTTSFSATTSISPSDFASEISVNNGDNIDPDFSGEYKAIQKGDVNGDGSINVQDVVLTVNIILGKITPTDDQRYAADVNSDGNINVQDVVRIVNIILGKA